MNYVLLQNSILGQFNHDIESFSKRESITESYLRSVLKDLEESFQQSKKYHNKIVLSEEEDCSEIKTYNESETFYKIRDAFYDLSSKITEMIPSTIQPSLEETINQTIALNSCSVTGVKPPRLEIQKFSGIYDEWKSFYNLFISTIHNDNKLNSVQKLQLLLSHVTGAARDLIKDTDI